MKLYTVSHYGKTGGSDRDEESRFLRNKARKEIRAGILEHFGTCHTRFTYLRRPIFLETSLSCNFQVTGRRPNARACVRAIQRRSHETPCTSRNHHERRENAEDSTLTLCHPRHKTSPTQSAPIQNSSILGGR